MKGRNQDQKVYKNRVKIEKITSAKFKIEKISCGKLNNDNSDHYNTIARNFFKSSIRIFDNK